MKTAFGFFGAGKMAEGILSAMTRLDGFDPASVIMAEKVPARARELSRRYGVATTPDVREVAKKAKTVFLAVRPQDLAEVAAAVRPLLTERHLVVSIVAGKTLQVLRKALGSKARLVRVMPNLALRAAEGMCAVCGGKNALPKDVKLVTRVLGAAGRTVQLAEKHFDAVTALSGSGPAFFAFMELVMAEGGVRLGLPRDAARLLAEQTMFGTAKYLRESNADLAEFIAGVATKGGTTAAGMDVLASGDFKSTVAETLAAAARRSAELRG